MTFVLGFGWLVAALLYLIGFAWYVATDVKEYRQQGISFQWSMVTSKFGWPLYMLSETTKKVWR